MRQDFFAHTLKGRPPQEWHRLEEHLRDTARLAGGFAAAFGAAEWGRLAGLWHDLGKYGEAFQRYLEASSDADGGAHASEMTGRVPHSTAGARHAVERDGRLGRLPAYAIAGHHAGLPDDVGGASSLTERLREDLYEFAAAPPAILEQPLPRPPALCGAVGAAAAGFSLAFFARMIFSCLVDADFLDTERFMAPGRAEQRPSGLPGCADLGDRLERHLAGVTRDAARTPVNVRRREVFESCLAKAAMSPGFFSLNVPTGGGKTLSSLAFALAHARAHGLRRVVYAIPYTSIIEQTAEVFRSALGNLGDAVLEHHSNLEPDDPVRQSQSSRLAAENFDAPLIVTTNVQLFESLFADRPSRCRKLHRLAGSVVVLDEAQALPPSLLGPTLAALKELVNNYGATVVLCTATQPAVERREEFPIGLTGVRPIIEDPAALHVALRRTSVATMGPKSNAELATALREEPRVLCIVNSRRHAADLYRELDDDSALHLSASMCAAHRSDVVAEIRRRLADRGAACRVISTQVIEAGVDVDFPAVYRAAAGLDSVAQAAGRCNREGRLVSADGRPSLGRVYIFDYDGRLYPTVPMIRRAAETFREVAADHRDDLLSPGAIEAFFRLHYWEQGGDDGRGWDRGAEGESVMACFEYDPEVLLHAQFRQAARAYRLIDEAQTPVLVPYGERGQALIRDLECLPVDAEPGRLRAFDRAAQRYVVGVFDGALAALLKNGVLLEHLGRHYLGNREAYDARLGLRLDVLGLDLERTII